MSKGEFLSDGSAVGGRELQGIPLLRNDANLVSYYRMEGDATDSKGGNNGSVTGADFNSSYGKFGQGCRFDSSGDYISLSETGFEFERTDPFSISAWIYFTSSVTYPMIFSKMGNDGANWRGYEFYYYNNAGNGLSLDIYSSNSNYLTVGIGSPTLSTSTWYHVVTTYDGSSATTGVKFYVNGILQTNTLNTSNLSSTIVNNYTPLIGNRNFDPVNFNGYIDDLAIFSRVLAQDEVNLIYKGGNTKGYWKLNGNSNDSSSNANNGTNTDITWSDNGRFGQCASFNGTTSKIRLPNNTFNSSTYTVSVWFKTSYDNSSNMFLFSAWNLTGTAKGISMGVAATTHYIFIDNYINGTEHSLLSSVVNDDKWYNAVMVGDGSTNVYLYLNGVLIKYATDWHTQDYNATTYCRIGTRDSDGGTTDLDFYNGLIDEVIIESRAWSAREVRNYFNSRRMYAAIIKDGSSAEKAPGSAAHLLTLGINTDGVYWINLPTVGPTQVYCLLNSAWDGGGWMMMMKATRGTTFNYSSNYWTTVNTLNPTQTNLSDGDAKFNVMNYFPAKDMLARFPDVSDGGSITITNSGWTWLENDFNSGGTSRVVPINFFASPSSYSRYYSPTYGGSGNFIKDAKTYNGWSGTKFSSQVDIRFYGFNYINNPTYGFNAKVRWGFGWNENGEGLFPSSNVANIGSNDVSGGIGMDSSFGSYSAGDYIGCCQDNTGYNRSMRVEVYVR